MKINKEVKMKNTILIILTALILAGCSSTGPKPAVTETVFYPPLPQEPRLQFLRSISSEADLGKKEKGLDEFLFGEDISTKDIGRPIDIAASKGRIYVSDREHKKILMLDLVGKSISYFNDLRAGSLVEPTGIWVTEDDHKYVADWGRKQVLVYGPDNKFITAYGGRDHFDKPVDVAVYENKIYVCDFGRHMIIVVNKDSGEIIEKIGGEGKQEGKFFKPTHVVVDHEGNIYVNDNFNFRVQKFNSEGHFKKIFGYLGDTPGSFARPKGLDIDKDDHLFVVDTAFENVQIFSDTTAELLLFFGGPGGRSGNMYLPSSIYIDYENVDHFTEYFDSDFKVEYLIYVGNQYGNNKINVYAFGKWTGAQLPDTMKKK